MNNDEQTDDSGGEIQVAKGPLLTSCPCDQMMSAEGAGSLSLSSPDTRKSRCSVAAEVAERWHGHRGAAGWSEGLCAQRSVSRGLCRASTAVLRPADAIPSPVISSAAMISPQCRLLHKDSHNLEAIRLLGICYLCREGNIYESHRFLHKDSHNLEAIRLSGICYLCREGNIYEIPVNWIVLCRNPSGISNREVYYFRHSAGYMYSNMGKTARTCDAEAQKGGLAENSPWI
ncbi:uncharacterized protein LOC143769817 isoform X3 [Ranitomeya variabilis]|uniref:uncharacterized protein LOC143769817 isoform X3 n=1 Tax=Ranitomeya variabilis TaxID=490064 RepID=UPI0040567D88